jgi:F420-dependent methylenetetrahydromethanopterin dehydrogenase
MSAEIHISIDAFRETLTKLGLEHIRTKNGHEVWARKDLLRPIVFSILNTEVPPMQVLSDCRAMGVGFEEIFEIIDV